MLVVVTRSRSLVHLYSSATWPRIRTAAVLRLPLAVHLRDAALVTADNFLQLFFGWEGVGLASYLLIGFWYRSGVANDAAIKAFVVNRVGDFGFALGIMAVFFLPSDDPVLPDGSRPGRRCSGAVNGVEVFAVA
jgi:NADH-quinone oxidoreductase subunit L